MDRVFKVHSVESEDLSSTQNLLNFHIPDGEMLDLSKSYVSLNARVTGGNADAEFAGSIWNVQGKMDSGGADTSRFMPSVSLVKHARLTSDSMGRIEELRDVNQLRLYTKNYSESQNKYLGNTYHNFMGLREYEDWGTTSPLIDVSAEGGQSSRGYIDKSVRIPLSDILNIGEVQMFDTRRLGKCKLNLEIHMSKLEASMDEYNDNYFTTQNNGRFVDVNVNAATSTFKLGSGAVSKKYDPDYQRRIPYYNGMPVIVASGALDGNNLANTKNTITNITYDETTGEVSLTLKDSLGTPTGASTGFVDVKIRPLKEGDITPATDISITLGQAELVLYSIGSNNMPSQVPDQISFTEYKVERDQGNGSTVFKRNYEVEGNAINALVIMKNNNDDLFSEKRATEGVRVAIDNNNQYDRDIFPDTPLYYHSLNTMVLNQGRNIKSVSQKIFSKKTATTNNNRGLFTNAGGADFGLSSIAIPLPVTQNLKMVELEIKKTAGGGIQDFSIYKEVVKTI
jgi:hypothetical protein